MENLSTLTKQLGSGIPFRLSQALPNQPSCMNDACKRSRGWESSKSHSRRRQGASHCPAVNPSVWKGTQDLHPNTQDSCSLKRQ